jgi:hypothetical protein
VLGDDALEEGGGVDEHGGPPRPTELVGEVLRHRRPVRPVPRHADAVVGGGAGGVLQQQRPPHAAHRRLSHRRLKPNGKCKASTTVETRSRVTKATSHTRRSACTQGRRRRTGLSTRRELVDIDKRDRLVQGSDLYLREQPGRVADEDGGDGAQRVEHLLGWAAMDVVVLLLVRFP